LDDRDDRRRLADHDVAVNFQGPYISTLHILAAIGRFDRNHDIRDNVEAYAPDSHFCCLRGRPSHRSSGNDQFVFSQPIGNDMVYSFDAANDQIDLIGYTGFTSFADVQANWPTTPMAMPC